MSLKADKGASAILIAVVMLLLMGFAALAIDFGAITNERRQDQAAADTAALAAAQFAQPNPGCTSTSTCAAQARTNGANEAILVANASLDDPSLADWSDPAMCGTPPAGFTAVTGVSSCVAFTSNVGRAWVRIPTIASPTFFAKLIGFDSVDVSADAIADAGFDNAGDVLPFLMPGNAAGTDYNCLKTGPNPSWGACEDLPTIGNFGAMDFFLYGNPELGTTQECTGATNARLVSNIARGIDHPLSKHPGPPYLASDEIHEATMCPIFSAEPNTANTQTGVGSNLERGLLYGGTALSTTGAYPGRIQDPSGYVVRSTSVPVPSAIVDDNPLWDYLKSSIPGLPVCNKTQVDTHPEMLACIFSAKASGTEIFTDDIAESKRFGFTPELWEADITGNPYHLKDYRPVYLDTTFYDCNATTCTISHTPGVADSGACPAAPEYLTCGTPGTFNKTLEAVTAYILSKDLLPPIAKEPAPGDDDQRRYNLSE